MHWRWTRTDGCIRSLADCHAFAALVRKLIVRSDPVQLRLSKGPTASMGQVGDISLPESDHTAILQEVRRFRDAPTLHRLALEMLHLLVCVV